MGRFCKHGNGNSAAIQRREFHSLRDLRFSHYCYWDWTPCRLVNSYRRFGGVCCFTFSVQEVEDVFS
jgi:hypothetical protein